MAITVAAGFPTSQSSTGQTTLAVTPVNIGDLIVLFIKSSSTTITCTGITGGGVASWHRWLQVNDTTNTEDDEIWYGIVTATGAATATATWSATHTAAVTELAAIEFHSSIAASMWGLVATATNSGTGTTITYPSITSNADALQAYVGYALCIGTPSAGATSGFTYLTTNNANQMAYNPGLSATTGYSPTSTQTSANWYTFACIVRAEAFLASANPPHRQAILRSSSR